MTSLLAYAPAFEVTAEFTTLGAHVTANRPANINTGLLGETLPEPIAFESQRELVRKRFAREVDLRAAGTEIVSLDEEPQSSIDCRNHMNSVGVQTRGACKRRNRSTTALITSNGSDERFQYAPQ